MGRYWMTRRVARLPLAVLTALALTVPLVPPIPAIAEAGMTEENPAQASLSPLKVVAGYKPNMAVPFYVTGGQLTDPLTWTLTNDADQSDVSGSVMVSGSASTGIVTFMTALAPGNYTLSVSTANGNLSGKVTVLPIPAVMVTPGIVSALNLPARLSLESDTDLFDPGTIVQLLASPNNVDTAAVAQVSVTDARHLSFDVTNGLAPGAYTVRVSTPTHEVSTQWQVAKAIQVNPPTVNADVDYEAAPITLGIFGHGTQFIAGPPVVTLVNSPYANSIGNVAAKSDSELHFELRGGKYAPGTLMVQVQSNGETFTAPLTFFQHARISGETRFPAGYTKAVLMLDLGSDFTLSPVPTVRVRKTGVQPFPEVTGAIESLTVVNGQMQVGLAPGLAAGGYVLDVSQNGKGTFLPFSVGLVRTPEVLVEGYSPSHTITLMGGAGSFQAGVSAIQVLSAGQEVAQGQNVAVSTDGGQVTFTLSSSLAAGQYEILVVTPNGTLKDLFMVDRAPGNLEAVVNDNRGGVLANTRLTLVRAENRTSMVGAIEAYTDANGLLRANLEPGNWVAIFHPDYRMEVEWDIPFTVVHATDRAANPGTIVQPAPLVALDQSELSAAYPSWYHMAVTGKHTWFTPYTTTVRLLKDGQDFTASHVRDVRVAYPDERVEFRLESGLPVGTYRVEVVTGDVKSVTSLAVVPGIRTQPDVEAGVDYSAQYRSLRIESAGVVFDATTQVTIVNSAMVPVPQAVAEVHLQDDMSLNVRLGGMFEPGQYWVRVATGGQVYQAPLTAHVYARILPDTVPSGYNGTELTFTPGTQVNLANGARAQVYVKNGGPVAGFENLAVTNVNGQWKVALPAGLPTGTYTLNIGSSTGGGVGLYFAVAFNSTPGALVQGYTLPQSITLRGDGLNLTAPATVEIWRMWPEKAADGAEVTVVDANTLQFTLTTVLQPDSYRIRVALGTREIWGELEVAKQPDNLVATLMNNAAPNPAPVRDAWVRFASAANKTESYELRTDANGILRGRLPVGDWIIEGWGMPNSPFTQVHIPVTILDSANSANNPQTIIQPAAQVLNGLEIPGGYHSRHFELQGRNTAWMPGVTKVSITQNGQSYDSMIESTDMWNGQTLAVRLREGLAVGTYAMTITTGDQVLTTELVVTPGVRLQGNMLPAHRDLGQEHFSVWAQAYGVSFTNTTRVEVRTLDGVLVEGAGAVVESVSPTEMQFSLTGTFEPGRYQFLFITDGGNFAAEFQAQVWPTLLQNRLTVGYTDGTIRVNPGTMLEISPAAIPYLRVRDWQWMEIPGLGEIKGTVVNGLLQYVLPPGLPVGRYQLEVGTDREGNRSSTSLELHVGFGLEPVVITEEHAVPLVITLTGGGEIVFDANTTVGITDDGGNMIAFGEDLTLMAGNRLQVTLNHRLHWGFWRLQVTAGGKTYTDTLQVQQLPRNLQATLKDYAGAPVSQASVIFFPADQVGNWEASRWGSTNGAGLVSARLPVGQWVIGGWWKNGQPQHSVRIPVEITNPDDYRLNPQELAEPQPNVAIDLKMGANALAGARVGIVPVTPEGMELWQQNTWVTADSQGRAKLALPVGSYKVTGVEVNGAQKQTQVYFSVTATGVLDGQNQPVSILQIALPVPNLSGQVFAGNSTTAAGFTSLSFRRVGGEFGEGDYAFTGTDQDGRFEVTLKPGRTFYVSEAWDREGQMYNFAETEYQVTVDANGVATPTALAVRLPVANVFGTALDEKNRPIYEGTVRIESEQDQTGRRTEYQARIRNGQWSAAMADGRYRVAGMWMQNRWVDSELVFEVIGGVASPTNLVVTPVAPNVAGVLKDRAGTPIQGGWITFKPAGAPEHDWSQARHTSTDSQGFFRTKLPETGDWMVVQAGGGSMWFNPGLTFSLPQANLVIEPERPTVIGELRGPDGQLMRSAHIGIGPAGMAETKEFWDQVKWVQVDGAGKFYVKLPAGTFKVFRIWHEGRSYEAAGSFTITDPGSVLNAVVQVPRPNLTGVVLTAGGQPVLHANVAVRPAGANENEWQHMKWINADYDGQFSAFLEPGEYVVRFVSSMDSWSEYQIPFSVSAANATTLRIQPPAPTVEGVVRDRNGQLLAHAQVGIRLAGQANGGTAPSWGRTNSQGVFALALPAGRYEIFGIGSPNGWLQAQGEFEVIGGALVQIAVAELAPNVTGTARDAEGRLVRRGHVGFLPAAAQGDRSRTVWAQTREDGTFELFLGQGDWLLTDIQGGENGVYHDLFRMNLKQTVVAGGTLALGVVQPPANNVTGRVYRDAAMTAPFETAWIGFRPADASPDDWSKVIWVGTDTAGNFGLYLKPGAYTIIQVNGANLPGYQTQIAVTAPGTTQPAVAIDVVPPAAFVSGSLTAAGQLVRASLGIRPVVNGVVSTDVSATKWVETGADGTWSTMLADGEYAVVVYDDGVTRSSLDVRFLVVNGRADVPVSR